MSSNPNRYPVSLSIDYPDRALNKLTSFFRIFTIIPIGIIAGIMGQTFPSLQVNTTYNTNSDEIKNFFAKYFASGADVKDIIALAIAAAFLAPIVLFIMFFIANLFNPIVIMLVFRQKYPKWWYDYYVNLVKFLTRVGSYLALMTDIYPSTDEEQNVHIEISYPDARKDLSQGLPLIKWFLAIPHYIVLCFLIFAAVVCDIIAWFAILFTGKFPKGLFDFIAGIFRWGLRVNAYAFLMVTDKYPPFSLD